MKKYIIIALIACFSWGIQQMGMGQTLYGKWVVSASTDPYQITAYELSFTSSSIVPTQMQTIYNTFSSYPISFSAGGYNANYETNLYFLGDYKCGISANSQWINPSWELEPEFQIIDVPDHPNQYYSIYVKGGTNLSKSINYLKVEYSPNYTTPNILEDQPIYGGMAYGFTGFAISHPNNTTSYLYAATVQNEVTDQGSLWRWTITENGMNNQTLIIDALNNGINDSRYFDAYNLECKTSSNGSDVIAWTHGYQDQYNNWDHVDEIVVINDGTPKIINLGLGRIGGIEFSIYDDNMLYASTTNGGIVKINYNTYQSTADIIPVENAPANDYSRTFLQTAPDGHIYGVSNDGRKMGRILQSGSTPGIFEYNDVFEFPGNRTLSSYMSFYDDNSGTNLNYYILPENERIYTALQTTIDVKPESCPNIFDGEVWITVTGGAPFSPPDDPYLISSDPELSFTWEEDDNRFHAEGLTAGTYGYTITDGATPNPNVITSTFIIKENDDYYDYKNDYYEVSENRSLPDADMPLNTYSFEKGILIRSGATLTITGSVYEFGKWAKVIIEPGATLELVGSTLTNHEECHLQWQGVEVQGNDNISQMYEIIDGERIYHQGRLLMNSSTISNAYEAVGLLARDQNGEVIWNSGGGIVIADNSSFINNNKSIHFIEYHNFVPGALATIDNLSYFTGCTFDVNENYIPSEIFYKHVDLDKVEGVSFKHCNFSLTATVGVSVYNQGIAAYQSKFKVLSECQNQIEPCPISEILHSTFTGFYRAIASYNADENNRKSFTVNQAVFSNNSTGIFCNNTNGAIVTNSKFEIGENPVSKANYQVSESFGIDIYSSLCFILEDNEFEKFIGAEDGHYTGIRAFECPSFSDVIYRNKYTGLSVGNLAEENNRSDKEDDKTGVTYECNRNYQNDYDFHIATLSRIRGNMGYLEKASGNILTNPSICESQLQNDGTQDIRYYYYIGNSPEWLTEFSEYVYVDSINIPNTCPTLHGTGGTSIKLTTVQKLAKETEYVEKLSDYNNVEVLYNSLMDGGSTDAELSDIESATPNEMWELRNKLLGDSPHLSQEVLIAMSDRTDVFPDAVLLEILSANPEELRKEELISYLEDKENPLPEYMIDILLQVANGSSYKSVLQNQMAMYHHEYVNAAQDIIRSLQHDSITDFVQLRYWLDNIGGYEMDKQIISTYMEEGNYTSAQSLLDILPSIYELNGDQLLAYSDYETMVELQIQLAQQQRNIHQLTSSELATITNLADNGLGSAKYSARSILEYVYGIHYFDRPSLPANIGLKTVKPIDQDEWAKAMGLELSVDPNPASTWSEFTWQLPPAVTRGLITITDISGKTITTISILGAQGKHVWDTRNIKSGVYICTLSVGKLVTSTKLIVK